MYNLLKIGRNLTYFSYKHDFCESALCNTMLRANPDSTAGCKALGRKGLNYTTAVNLSKFMKLQ